MSGHTKGPWFVAFDGDPEDIRVCQQSPDQMEPHCMCCVALMGNTDERGRWTRGTVEEWLANARRIVAAVNACQGIPTGALEGGVVTDLLEALQRAVEDAEATLRYGCCGETEGGEYHPAHHPTCWVPDARAAIAKANGADQ